MSQPVSTSRCEAGHPQTAHSRQRPLPLRALTPHAVPGRRHVSTPLLASASERDCVPGTHSVRPAPSASAPGACMQSGAHAFESAASCHREAPPAPGRFLGRHPAWGHSSHPGVCTAAGTRLRGGAVSSLAGLLLSTRWEGLAHHRSCSLLSALCVSVLPAHRPVLPSKCFLMELLPFLQI